MQYSNSVFEENKYIIMTHRHCDIGKRHTKEHSKEHRRIIQLDTQIVLPLRLNAERGWSISMHVCNCYALPMGINSMWLTTYHGKVDAIQ